MNQEIQSFKRDSKELELALYEGVVIRHGEPWAALPRETVRTANGSEAVIFEIVRHSDFERPMWWQRIWVAIRPETFLWSGVPFLIVWLYGELSEGVESSEVSLLLGLCALLGVVFFQIAARFWSDVEDYLRLPAAGQEGVLHRGWMTAKQLRQLGLCALLLGICFGMPVVWAGPSWLLGLGALGVVGIYSFSRPPFEFKYRGLGEVLIFFLLGPLLFLGYTQALFMEVSSQMWIGVICLASCFGALACTIPHANRLQFFAGRDGVQGSFRKSRHLLLFQYGFAYAAVSVGALGKGYPVWVPLSLVILLPSVVQFLSRIYVASGPASALLGNVRRKTMSIYAFAGGLVILSLLFSLVSSHG